MDKKFFVIISTPIAISVVALGTVLFFWYGYEDSATVLAGMLGFVGAIIGGTITWLGVNKTIENSNKIEKNKLLKAEYEANMQTIRVFGKMVGDIWEHTNEFHSPYKEILECCRVALDGTGGLLDIAIKSSEKTFKIIEELWVFVENDYGLIINQGYSESYQYMYSPLEKKITTALKQLKEEKKNLQRMVNSSRI